MKYRAGYKYQLAETARLQSSIRPPEPITTEYISLDTDGILTLREGYASDGPSGPTVDTASFMAPAFGHDGLYQLIRLGLLPASARLLADQDLRRWCLQCGMWSVRAWYVYRSVRRFGAPSADPANRRRVITVPTPPLNGSRHP